MLVVIACLKICLSFIRHPFVTAAGAIAISQVAYAKAFSGSVFSLPPLKQVLAGSLKANAQPILVDLSHQAAFRFTVDRRNAQSTSGRRSSQVTAPFVAFSISGQRSIGTRFFTHFDTACTLIPNRFATNSWPPGTISIHGFWEMFCSFIPPLNHRFIYHSTASCLQRNFDW